MSDYILIPVNEVRVDAFTGTGTFLSLRERDDFLKEVSEGTNAVKIPGQALTVQAPGGDGVAIDRFNHELASGTLNFVGNESKNADTGVAGTADKIPLFNLEVVSGDGDFLVRPGLTGTGNSRFRVTRSDGAGNASVDWKAYILAAT